MDTSSEGFVTLPHAPERMNFSLCSSLIFQWYISSVNLFLKYWCEFCLCSYGYNRGASSEPWHFFNQ
jgi:hypothetical protein